MRANAYQQVVHTKEVSTLQRQETLINLRSALAPPPSKGLLVPVFIAVVQQPLPDTAVQKGVSMHSSGSIRAGRFEAKNTVRNVEAKSAKSAFTSTSMRSTAYHKHGSTSIPVPPTSARLAVFTPKDASPACSVASTAKAARGRGRDTPRTPTIDARNATYKPEASWNTVVQKLHVHVPPCSPSSNLLHREDSTPVAVASPQGFRFSRAESPSQARHSLPADPAGCRVAAQPQARFPSDNPFGAANRICKAPKTNHTLMAMHQALSLARLMPHDSRKSVGSNESTTGKSPLREAAPNASAVCQQLEETKKENASLKKQVNTATKMLGRLQQHSRILMHQLQREVSRSQRLEQDLIDFNLLQCAAIGSVSTTEVGATAEVAALGRASVGTTDVSPFPPSFSLPTVVCCQNAEDLQKSPVN